MSLRLALIGNGNIASELTRTIAERRDYDIVGVVTRGGSVPPCDLLVEVAAPEAVAEFVAPAAGSGTDVIVVSVGALADPVLRERLTSAPGTVFAATGAVGGLEHIRAMHEAGGVASAHIESRKIPATLIQPWMDPELVARLRAGDERIVVAEGTAQHVAALFPRSANVAVAVALAADAWNRTTARMIADPEAVNTTHVITAEGAAGSCRFEATNLPSPEQPRSSAIVASSVLRSIDTYAALRTHGANGLIPLL